jgi:DegV family protein with EDD domain
MKDYIIITDSTTDLPQDLIEKLGIEIIPLMFNIDGNEFFNYLDGLRPDPQSFYNLLRSGKMAGTSAINTSSFIEIFESYLKAGTDVLYIAFSSALSGTCNNAMSAAGELAPKYPERKVLALDSLSASLGEGLLVFLAAHEKEKGRSIDEVYDFVLENRLKVCHWFTVDDLNHLKRGGRVSATAALLGTVLGIKPILHVDDQGRLIPVSKVRGRRQSLEQLVEKMAVTGEAPRDQTVFISHGDCIDDARFVESMMRDRFKIKDIVINYVGPVIGAHSGPGTIAIFFLGGPR